MRTKKESASQTHTPFFIAAIVAATVRRSLNVKIGGASAATGGEGRRRSCRRDATALAERADDAKNK